MTDAEKIRRALEEDTFYPDTARLLRDKLLQIEKLNQFWVQSAVKRFENCTLRFGEVYGYTKEGWNQYQADMRLLADYYVCVRCVLQNAN